MNRQIILLALAMSLVAGCTSRSAPFTGAEGPSQLQQSGAVVEHAVAALPKIHPVSEAVFDLITKDPSPLLGGLPGLPQEDLPLKLPLEITEFWRNGDESYAHSANTIKGLTNRILESVDENPSWAIYQVTNIRPLTELIQLMIEVSNTNFGGSYPGYYICIANYADDKWQVLARSPALTRNIPFTISEPFISPAQNVYVLLALVGEQSISIERVGLEFDTPAWVEVVVDSDEGCGWMPAITFDLQNNPLVAYADLSTGVPRLAVGNRDLGLGDPGNWVRTFIDPFPEDSGGEPDTGAKAKWLDIVLDPNVGLPRVSMIYDEITGKDETSRAGMSVMTSGGQWANYRFGWIDDAEWTSIDYQPGTTVFGMATHAKNTHYILTREPYDLTYITFDIFDQDRIYDQYYGFGSYWSYPHLMYDPVDGTGMLQVFGSSSLYEDSPEDWVPFYDEPRSREFGSLGKNPANGHFGSTYVKEYATHWELIYVEYDAVLVGTEEVVDTVERVNGVERIADVSQLAYMPDGTPAIAYTIFDGNFVDIKYAQKQGEVWDPLIISAEHSLAFEEQDKIVVDLAIDPAGVPVVCYHHLDTQGNSSLRVVFNEG